MAVTDPVPARVDATGKAGLLALVDHAVSEGWTLHAVCEVLQISRRRVERWQHRRTDLVDRRPGGVAVNSLLDEEVAQILAVFDEWGERDRGNAEPLVDSFPYPARQAGVFMMVSNSIGVNFPSLR